EWLAYHGFIARDLGKDPWARPAEGSGCLPRAFDVPILLGALAWSLLVRIFTFLSLYVIPFVEIVEIFFGKNMREYFCSRHHEWELSMGDDLAGPELMSQNMLLDLCTLPLQLFFLALVVAIALRVLTALKCFGKHGSIGDLWLHGCSAAVARLAALMAVLVIIVGTTTFFEKWATEMHVHKGRGACAAYTAHVEKVRQNCSSLNGRWLSWASRYHEVEFYEVARGHGSHQRNGSVIFPSIVHNLKRMNSTIAEGVTRGAEDLARTLSDSLIPATWTLLMVAILGTLMFVPFFPSTIATIVMLVLPIMVSALFGSIVQWRVFGTLRRIQLLAWNHAYYRSDTWAMMYQGSLIASMIILPFYLFLRGNSHKFYRRSLRRAFFAGGKEVPWGRIADNPFCPMLILNAAVIARWRIYPGSAHPGADEGERLGKGSAKAAARSWLLLHLWALSWTNGGLQRWEAPGSSCVQRIRPFSIPPFVAHPGHPINHLTVTPYHTGAGDPCSDRPTGPDL
ncbi:unnamed protein product, partial [Prorocentrum cordatum]